MSNEGAAQMCSYCLRAVYGSCEKHLTVKSYVVMR